MTLTFVALVLISNNIRTFLAHTKLAFFQSTATSTNLLNFLPDEPKLSIENTRWCLVAYLTGALITFFISTRLTSCKCPPIVFQDYVTVSTIFVCRTFSLHSAAALYIDFVNICIVNFSKGFIVLRESRQTRFFANSYQQFVPFNPLWVWCHHSQDTAHSFEPFPFSCISVSAFHRSSPSTMEAPNCILFPSQLPLSILVVPFYATFFTYLLDVQIKMRIWTAL